VSVRGVVDVRLLSREMRGRILELEARLEANPSGLGFFRNEGVHEVMEREIVLALLSDTRFRHGSQASLVWAVDGVIIGEEVPNGRGLDSTASDKEFKAPGGRFVLHMDRIEKVSRTGKSCLIVKPLPFPELEGVEGVKRVVSASPSTEVDLFIRESLGWDLLDRSLGTILLGFDWCQGIEC